MFDLQSSNRFLVSAVQQSWFYASIRDLIVLGEHVAHGHCGFLGLVV